MESPRTKELNKQDLENRNQDSSEDPRRRDSRALSGVPSPAAEVSLHQRQTPAMDCPGSLIMWPPNTLGPGLADQNCKVSDKSHCLREGMLNPKAAAVPILQVRTLSLSFDRGGVVGQVFVGCKEKKHSQVSLQDGGKQSLSHPASLLEAGTALVYSKQQLCKSGGPPWKTLRRGTLTWHTRAPPSW